MKEADVAAINMIVEKDISQLAVGSYVVGIADQTGSFKIKNPGWVRDFSAIEALIHRGVQRVIVDTSKQLPSPDELKAAKQNKILKDKKAEQNAAEEARKDTQFEKQSFAEDFYRAQELFDEAKQVQSRVLEDIKQGRPIDSAPLFDLSNQTIDTIFHNSDAIACVVNIRLKDEYLLEHSTAVSILMTIFAKFLKIDRDIVTELAVGAFLHDVGKILIPDEIMNKPGRLTEAEFEVMKSHVVHSANIVRQTQGLSDLTRGIVANHHEKLNGVGYPRGLREDQIDRYSRMITICDIFDALTADRVYKDGMAQIKAFAILRQLAQRGELDAVLVDQFIKCLGVYPVGSLVKLDSEKLAIVEKVNKDNPIKPVVKVFFSLKQNTFLEAKDIDLALDETQQIEQGVRADDFDLDMNKITEFLIMQG